MLISPGVLLMPSEANLLVRVLSSWQEAAVCGTVLDMSTTSNPYRGYRFPAEIINQAVWLYHCFSLSLREVELILAARGIMVSYETIREWSLRFGRTYANSLKRRRPQPGDKWFLDEVFVRIRGKLHYFGEPLISMGTCSTFCSRAGATRRLPSASFASC
jgi:putative transposase